MISDVEGSFKNFTASIKAPKADFTDAQVEMSADIASINTDNEGRDKHLQSPDYFDAAKFPKLTFVSKSFTKTGANTYSVTGDLTIHGVTKSVTFNEVLIPYKSFLIAIASSFKAFLFSVLTNSFIFKITLSDANKDIFKNSACISF